jgi:hypothetical protein
MADERDLSNKLADGLWSVGKSVGSKIGDAAKNLGSQAVDLYNMSPEDQAAAIATGDGESILEAQDNFQDVQSTLNAQNPTPTPNTFMVDEMNPVAQLNANTAAFQAERPLSADDAVAASKGIVPVPEAYKGTAASVAAPQAQQLEQVAPPSAAQLPAAIDPFAGSNALAIQGIRSAEKAGAEAAAAEHAYFQKKADAEALAMDKQEKLQEAFEFKFQEKLDGYEQSVREFKDLAGEKIVPGAFLARQDTQGSLMTGLAIALGGIGGALQGTNKNIGLEMIEKAIDRDVAAQQFNAEYKYKVKGQDLQNQNSLLNKMREKFGDDKSAILATKAAMLDMVQSKMNMELTKKGGARDLNVQAQAQTAMAQIVQRKELYTAQLKAEQAKQYEQQQMFAGKDKNNLSPEEAVSLYGDKLSQQYVSGFGLARSKEDKKKFQEEYGDSKNSLDALKTIISADINKLSPDDRARLGTELSLLTGKMRLAVLGPGAMTEAEYDRLRDALGDPTKIVTFPGTQLLKLRTVQSRLQKAQDNAVNLYFGKEKFNELKNSSNNVDSLVKKN